MGGTLGCRPAPIFASRQIDADWQEKRKVMFKRGLVMLLVLCAAWTAGAAWAEEDKPRRVVYLTFDDGPKKDTPELLKVLDDLDVPATFVLVGACVRAFTVIAKFIFEACHAI